MELPSHIQVPRLGRKVFAHWLHLAPLAPQYLPSMPSSRATISPIVLASDALNGYTYFVFSEKGRGDDSPEACQVIGRIQSHG